MAFVFDPNEKEIEVLGLIRENESADQYNKLCGGGRFKDYSAFPHWKGFRGSHAAGAYQFEPATWMWCTDNTGVKDFSPHSQDVNALWLLRRVGPNSTASWAASGPYPEVK